MKIKIFILFILFFTNLTYSRDIYWYLAASMKEPAQIIIDKFNNRRNRQFNIYIISGGSGQLLSKIYSSKTGDIYMPADKSYLDKALALGIIKDYKPFLSQKPVIGIAKKSDRIIKNIADLCNKNIDIALGNPETMALGKIFQDMKKTIPHNIYNCLIANKSVEAINVQQIMNYIKLNIVDAGFIFKPMAESNKITYLEIPKKWNILSNIYICKLIYAKNDYYTKKAINYILSHIGTFEKYGFNVIK